MKYTIVEYINQLRIQLAKQQLMETDLSITQIATDCGFATTSYFIQVFKRYSYVSPGTFRKIKKAKASPYITRTQNK